MDFLTGCFIAFGFWIYFDYQAWKANKKKGVNNEKEL